MNWTTKPPAEPGFYWIQPLDVYDDPVGGAKPMAALLVKPPTGDGPLVYMANTNGVVCINTPHRWLKVAPYAEPVVPPPPHPVTQSGRAMWRIQFSDGRVCPVHCHRSADGGDHPCVASVWLGSGELRARGVDYDEARSRLLDTVLCALSPGPLFDTTTARLVPPEEAT